MNIEDIKEEDGGFADLWEQTSSSDWLAVGETFYNWTGTHWQPDNCGRLRRQIANMLDAVNTQARVNLATLPPTIKGEPDPHAASRAHLVDLRRASERSRGRVFSIVGLVAPLVAIEPDELDQGDSLNLANGTFDLSSCTLRPHAREDRLTYVLPYAYDPAATCPRWEQFLVEVLGNESEGTWQPDQHLVRLVQMAVGYTLTTDTRHEKMFWLSGEGSNGKSTLLSVLQELLSGLSVLADFHAMAQPGNYDLVRLRGKRLALSTESTKGRGLAEGILKRVVTGERIHARQIYLPPVEFTATSKVWWSMNDRPEVRDTTNAIWRRLTLIPFNRTFSERERDRNLLQTLLTELPGILNWALAGLNALHKAGRFPEVEAVKSAVDEYKHQANPVALWLEEKCTVPNENGERVGPDGSPIWTPAKACYTAFATWVQANGQRSMTSTMFGNELRRLVRRMRDTRGNHYQLELLVDDDEPVQHRLLAQEDASRM